MDLFNGALGAIGELRQIIILLTEKSKSTNIQKKLIIRELRDNLKMYQNVLLKNLSIDLLIDNISNKEINNAIKNDFNFKKLKKGVIEKKIIKEKRNKKYIGWTAEKLINKIDEKIEELRNLKKLSNGTVVKTVMSKS